MGWTLEKEQIIILLITHWVFVFATSICCFLKKTPGTTTLDISLSPGMINGALKSTHTLVRFYASSIQWGKTQTHFLCVCCRFSTHKSCNIYICSSLFWPGTRFFLKYLVPASFFLWFLLCITHSVNKVSSNQLTVLTPALHLGKNSLYITIKHRSTTNMTA